MASMSLTAAPASAAVVQAHTVAAAGRIDGREVHSGRWLAAGTRDDVSPPHAAGTVDVKATVNKAASAKNAPADQFTYS